MKKSNKVLCAAICMVMFFSMMSGVAFFAQEPYAVTLSSARGEVDDTVYLTISIPADTNLGNTRINLSYDKQKLQYVDTQSGEIGGKGMVQAVENPTCVSVGFITVNGIKEAGAIAKIGFKILSGDDGAEYSVTLDVVEFVDADTDAKLATTVENGKITVGSAFAVKGDLDKNGKVEINDAMRIFASVAGKTVLTADEESLADLNNDTKVSIIDAIMVFNIVAGKKA